MNKQPTITKIPYLRQDSTTGVADVEYLQNPVQLKVVVDDKIYVDNESADLFTALGNIRTKLEQIGIKLMCNGSAYNVFVSGMQSQMTAGLYASMVIPGKNYTEQVNIFDANMNIRYATVEEQRSFIDRLISGNGSNPD